MIDVFYIFEIIWIKSNCVLNTLRNLAELPLGSQGTIVEVRDKELMNRLCEMGLKPGDVVKLENKAPFNGSYTVSSKHLKLAIRRENLKKIFIQSI